MDPGASASPGSEAPYETVSKQSSQSRYPRADNGNSSGKKSTGQTTATALDAKAAWGSHPSLAYERQSGRVSDGRYRITTNASTAQPGWPTVPSVRIRI